MNNPVGIAANSAGELYVADSFNNVVRQIRTDGTISKFAGNGNQNLMGDGGPAEAASLNRPTHLAWSSNGDLYIADTGNFKIRKVNPVLQITTVAGNGSSPSATNPLGDGGAASQASFNDIQGLAILQDGSIAVSDRGYNVIRKVAPFFSGTTDQNYSFASEDGSEIYIFELNGRHKKTINALTGGTRWEFGYDGNNRLVTMTDGDNNLTTISRDGSGHPTSITGPFGHVTTLSQDSGGRLATITNPNNETYRMTYNAIGLLSEFKRPSGHSSTFEYDALGNLTKDIDAVSGFTSLAKIFSNYRNEVQIGTAEGRSSKIIHTVNSGGADIVRHTDAAGLNTTTTSSGMNALFQGPTNSLDVSSTVADPLLGYPATVPDLRAIKHGNIQASIAFTRTITPSVTSDPFAFTKVDTVTTNGSTVKTTYNGAGRIYVSSNPQTGRTVTGAIDLQGRLLSHQLGSLAPVSFTYDSNGRLKGIIQDGRETGFGYDSRGNLSSLKDALNRTTSYQHDLSGRVTRTTFHDGRFVDFGYDADGNLTSVTPPGRPTHFFSFSPVNLFASYWAPQLAGQGNVTQYGYNRDKQLTLITRPDASVLSFSYDGGARLKTISTAQGAIGFNYSATTGQLTSSTSIEGVSKNITYQGDLVKTITIQFTPPGANAVTYTETYGP
ncbi:MAG: hypothetical protein HC883_03460 [Bdellovibrionaceae bacterium]|nr:hypothetical protein [Pseudobdellovibrionaceae bacterium]